MQFTVLTVNYWEGRHADAACQYIAAARPDVVAMQEVPRPSDEVHCPEELEDPNYSSWPRLAKTLEGYEIAWAPTYCTQGPHGRYSRGNVIFSRFPIVAAQVKFAESGAGRFVDDYKVPVLISARAHVAALVPAVFPVKSNGGA